MSRGREITERAALEVLRAKGSAFVLEIAAAATAPPDATGVVVISNSVYHSFARALRSLAKAGLVVDLGRGWRAGARRYSMPDAADAHRTQTFRAFGKDAIRVARPLAPGVGGRAGVRLRKPVARTIPVEDLDASNGE
jgi:hypothetical protein